MSGKGFKKVDRKLKQFERNASKVSGDNELSFEELFPPSFMSAHTNFNSFQEMLDQSPFEVKSQKDFEAIPNYEFDTYISQSTNFSSWKGMQQKAVAEWTSKKLGF
ncbi:hypothetical protein SAMN05216353_10724 [Halobacillus alkaliphilus]|uniref:Uncharacterized protein n=1 Tax=Halobacillus alkaliphilus TaxID=396056 RepID=A0A1I2L6L5_9BACI|nr:hypothetical protein [Halobacillus alkaliphilus]SFF72766.1 hypothetical protein SAMN05216353_10724 [Halobacillus alkaliphilus]